MRAWRFLSKEQVWGGRPFREGGREGTKGGREGTKGGREGGEAVSRLWGCGGRGAAAAGACTWTHKPGGM